MDKKSGIRNKMLSQSFIFSFFFSCRFDNASPNADPEYLTMEYKGVVST